jgi:hypothetical protein
MGVIDPRLLAVDSVPQLQPLYPDLSYNFQQPQQPQQPVLCSRCGCDVAVAGGNQVVAEALLPQVQALVSSLVAGLMQARFDSHATPAPAPVASPYINNPYQMARQDILAEIAAMTPEQLEEYLNTPLN